MLVKPLFIPLLGVYYDQFISGEKHTEYRKYGPRWNERTCPVGRKVLLSRGYGRAQRSYGEITWSFKQDSMPWNKPYLDIYGDVPAMCIEIKLDEETS